MYLGTRKFRVGFVSVAFSLFPLHTPPLQIAMTKTTLGSGPSLSINTNTINTSPTRSTVHPVVRTRARFVVVLKSLQ